MKISPENSCPCGSGEPFAKCCQKIHRDHSLATSAEQLMRSRYSAFADQNFSYILKSWHKNNRPYKMGSEMDGIEWLKLIIHGCEKGGAEENSGSVHFTAYYREGEQLYALEEKSLFRKKKRLWYYLSGKANVKEVEELP